MQVLLLTIALLHFSRFSAHNLSSNRLILQLIERRRLNAYRIAYGKELLQTTTLSVGRVATACGFKSQSRFGEVFRRLEGLTPRGSRGR